METVQANLSIELNVTCPHCDDYMKIDEAFERFVKIKETKIGATADCCLGLWGVSGPSKEEVLRQARHYFVQYWGDGEYDHLINT